MNCPLCGRIMELKRSKEKELYMYWYCLYCGYGKKHKGIDKFIE